MKKKRMKTEELGVHSRHVEDCHVETHLDVVVSSTLSLRKIMKPIASVRLAPPKRI